MRERKKDRGVKLESGRWLCCRSKTGRVRREGRSIWHNRQSDSKMEGGTKRRGEVEAVDEVRGEEQKGGQGRRREGKYRNK